MINTKNILINQNNVVVGSNNSIYTYKFISPQTFTNSYIALNSLQMYYSWYNINANLYNNNQFQYMWWDTNGVLNQTTNVVIPDGFYTVDTLNLYIQSVFASKGHYIIDNNNKNIYFFQIVANPSLYAFQINLTPMYISLPTGYLKGGSNWNLPTTQNTMRIIINSSNDFKKLIGFNAGTYPSTNQTQLYQVVSQYAPEISPVSSVIMRCNLVKNDIANPNDVLYSFTSGTNAFGDILNERPTSMNFSHIQDGTYTELKLQFYDQNYRQMKILDSQLLINIVIYTDENKNI